MKSLDRRVRSSCWRSGPTCCDRSTRFRRTSPAASAIRSASNARRRGQYFVFDRRSQIVWGVDPRGESAWEIVHIGNEPGRILNPFAFAVAPDGTFAVGDAPNNQERIQIFTPAGFRIGGFTLPGKPRARVSLDGLVLNGIGSLQYTGTSILLSQPDTGSLVSEYSLDRRADPQFRSNCARPATRTTPPSTRC